MEKKAVQDVLDQTPETEAGRPASGLFPATGEAFVGKVCTIRDARQPDDRDHPPGRLGQRLEEVAEQRGGLASLVMARTVDLVQVELFAEATVPDLREKGATQVQELVLLVVAAIVGLLAQVLLAGHACPGVDPSRRAFADCFRSGADRFLGRSIGRALGSNDEADEGVIEHIVGGLGVRVGGFVAENLFDVFAGVFEDKVGTARMILCEIGHIVDFVVNGDIARFAGVVGFNLGAGEGWQGAGWHGCRLEWRVSPPSRKQCR